MDKILNAAKSLADRNRLRIVAALLDWEEMCACQITELLKVSGATASRHLSLLVQSDIVASRKEGRWVYYRLKKGNEYRSLLGWVKRGLVASDTANADRQILKKIMKLNPEEICRKQRGERCCSKK